MTQGMAELRDEGCLHVRKLLFFSLLRNTQHNPELSSAKSQMLGYAYSFGQVAWVGGIQANVSPPPLVLSLSFTSTNPVVAFLGTIEDFGWMGKWYNLEKAMLDYDVPDS